MKRGEVHWADLVPRSGSEQTGRRPVIVVSHDAFNQTPAWRTIHRRADIHILVARQARPYRRRDSWWRRRPVQDKHF